MGRIEISDLKLITSEPLVGYGTDCNQSEMALFSQRTESCGKQVLDTAGVVRDAMFQQRRYEISSLDLESRSNLEHTR